MLEVAQLNVESSRKAAFESAFVIRSLRAFAAVAAVVSFAPLAAAQERSLSVVATAYNSTRAQTNEQPNEGAWGDRIVPGMKVIAVSPDLVKIGLNRGTKVRIDGVEGEWTVLDRTPSRLRNHIDLYMGVDVRAARKWGRKKVTIRWGEQREADSG